MMAERGLAVDHSSMHRWVVKLLPLFEKAFRRHKRPVGTSWRTDETYLKVRGQWKYLYRAVDNAGNTIDFLLRAHRGPSVLIATEPILESITAARLQTQNV
jgi:putative transposase